MGNFPRQCPMHTLARALLTEIEAFLGETGLTPTKFGLAAVNDGHLVANLRRGNSVTLKTADRVRAFMRASVPAPHAGAAIAAVMRPSLLAPTQASAVRGASREAGVDKRVGLVSGGGVAAYELLEVYTLLREW